MSVQWIYPDWPAAANVHGLITTRAGGVSRGPYGVPPNDQGGMNIGLGSGDNLADVQANRARLRALLPAAPHWLHQVHGAVVVDARQGDANAMADASFTDAANVVCAVSIADCMPVLLTDASGRAVGIAHAGWRGLAAGVIQATAQAMRQKLENSDAELLAYLGPGSDRVILKSAPSAGCDAGVPAQGEPRVYTAAEWQVPGRSVRTGTSGA